MRIIIRTISLWANWTTERKPMKICCNIRMMSIWKRETQIFLDLNQCIILINWTIFVHYTSTTTWRMIIKTLRVREIKSIMNSTKKNIEKRISRNSSTKRKNIIKRKKELSTHFSINRLQKMLFENNYKIMTNPKSNN